jgi:hypothetical protein
MKPRRKGTLEEYQNGRWFLYHVMWEEQTLDDGTKARPHEEFEVYYNESKVVFDSTGKSDPLWNSTDIKQFSKALDLFVNAPEKFKEVKEGGILPE